MGLRGRLLVLGAMVGCGTSPVVIDAGPADATIDKKVPPSFDAGEAGDAALPTLPEHLADTGLYADFASRTLAPGIISYEPRYPLWSDGAEKKRYLLLPPNTRIDTSDMDSWSFPVGTKVWKEFDVGATVDGSAEGGTSPMVAVETRLLWKIGDAQWLEVAYAWDAAESDAVATPDGGADALGTTHRIPSQLDCNACHANVRDVLIGVSALQLGASDGDGTLGKLASAGLLTNAPAAAYDVPGSGVTKEALGYLHGNCGHCHNSDWASPTLQKQTSMRLRLSVANTTPEGSPVYKTAMCLPMKHVVPPDVVDTIVPGDPDASGIPARMNRRDSFEMPPNCTDLVDEAGVATVSAWVASLEGGCPDAGTD